MNPDPPLITDLYPLIICGGVLFLGLIILRFVTFEILLRNYRRMNQSRAEENLEVYENSRL